MNAAERSFWSRVNVGTPDVCWPWQRTRTATGYGVVSWAGRSTTAHRLAYILVNGETDAQHICHSCDNPTCCNPFHLWAGSALDNARDKIAKGRCVFTSLSEAQARRAKFGIERPVDLAREFGVSGAAISRIRTGKTWVWLKPLDEAA